MTPAMIIILTLAAIMIWFLAAGLFKPIGSLFSKIFNDAVDIINEEEKEDNE